MLSRPTFCLSMVEGLEVVNRRGWAAIIVTNQKCVHKGLISEEQLDAIHQKIWDVVDVERLELRAIYAAIKGDEDIDAKPNPGMLIKAAADYDLDLSRSWMIGDSQRDMEAGSRAGCAELVRCNADTIHGHTCPQSTSFLACCLRGWIRYRLILCGDLVTRENFLAS